MDKKTKHRILGVLVVIGLVIILLPFFQTEKGLSQETTLVKAPPFPDQAVQVTASVPSQTQDNLESQTNPGLQASSVQSQNDVDQMPDDTINIVKPSIINAKTPEMNGEIPSTNVNPKIDNAIKAPIQADEAKAAEIPAFETQDEDVEAQMVDANEKINIKEKKAQKPIIVAQQSNDNAKKIKPFTPKIKPFIPEAKHTQNAKIQSSSPMTASLDKDGLAKLQNAAWVIQIGSFKNKTNALRLVNQLRANGYNAFIQQVSTTFGDSTRVFVGPESKHTAARALASQLENDLHIHGIVISYKPLAL